MAQPDEADAIHDITLLQRVQPCPLRWTKTTKIEDRIWAPNAPPMWHPFPPNEQGRRVGAAI